MGDARVGGDFAPLFLWDTSRIFRAPSVHNFEGGFRNSCNTHKNRGLDEASLFTKKRKLFLLCETVVASALLPWSQRNVGLLSEKLIFKNTKKLIDEKRALCFNGNSLENSFLVFKKIRFSY